MGTRLAALDAGTDVLKTEILLAQQGGVDKKVAASELPLPLNYIAGLITSNGTDADHDIDIAVGVARSADDSLNLKLAAVLTKQIDAAWAVGDDQGGIDTGSVAVDTLYAIWLIKRPDTGVVDALFSTSFSAPTMPANYTKKRLIGAVLTDGSSNIEEYEQVGDRFTWTASQSVVSDSSLTSGVWETATILIPPSAVLIGWGETLLTTPYATYVNAQTRKTIPGSGAQTFIFSESGAASTTERDSSTMYLAVDVNQQFDYQVTWIGSPTAKSLNIFAAGFDMLTRRDP